MNNMQCFDMHVHVHTGRVLEYLLFEVKLTRVVRSIYQRGQLMFLHGGNLNELILRARNIVEHVILSNIETDS